MSPLIITFLATIAVLIYFLVYGLLNYSTTKNSESYFLYNRELASGEYANSFAAASTSLATVLFFFVVLGTEWGLYILFSPLSFFFGIWFFKKFIIPRLEEHNFVAKYSETSPKSAGTTIGNYIFERYNSKLIQYIVVSITLIGIMAILLIELYVGIDIFNIFIVSEYKEYILIVIAFVAFIYTGFGGLSAVIKTDKKQLWYMLIVASILIVWLISANTNTITTTNFFPPIIPIKQGLLLPWPLFLNILFINFFLIPSLLRNWQITAASKNSEEVKKGLNKGLVLLAILSGLFIIFGILFFNIFPETDKSLNGILIALANSNSNIASLILLPLFFTACLAALLSTVDSSLIPVLQSIFQDFPLIKNKTNNKNYFIATILILLFAIGLYFIVFKILKFNLIGWLFTLFGLVTITGPAIILGCVGKKEILHTNTMKVSVVFATILGLITSLYISIYGNSLSESWIIQLNAPIALILISVLIGIPYIILNKMKMR